MSKFVEQEYGSTKEILKFPDHYVALAVMVSDSGVTANEFGKKIVPKGTIVGGASAAVLENLGEAVVNKFVDAAYAKKTIGSADSNNAILLTALEPGAGGNDISITLTAPDEASQELAVSVSGTDITVSLATSAEKAITSTAAEVAAAINEDEEASALVTATADIENNDGGSGVCAAVAKTSLADGNNGSATGAEGVLKNDIDVTYGPKEGAMVIHGFVKIDALPYGAKNELAAAAAATVLAPGVKFIK